MKTTQGIIFMSALFLLIGIVLTIAYLKYSDYVVYKLPTNVGPDEFGKYYWNALHSTVERIPCSICRDEAVPLMKFMHDIVNKKLEKPIYDEKNFSEWINKVCEMKKNIQSNN